MLVTDKESEILFGNQADILSLNKRILSILVSEKTKENEEQDFGSIFLKYAPLLLESYSPYCSNLVKARHLKNKLSQKRDGFMEFLAEAQNNPNAKKQDLNSFLIKPLQRLCKYPLLLKELAKTTVNSKSIPNLHQAIKKMDNVLNIVNDRMVKLEKQGPLLDIQDMFEEVSIY